MKLKKSGIDIDIVCLTEHFIDKEHQNYFKLNGFKLVAMYSRDNNRGGTCILCKNEYACYELVDVKEMAIERHFEICGIEIKKINVIILCF